MIAHAVTLAFFCFGLHLATRSGMLLAWVGDGISDALGWLSKPLTECPACMAGSVWCLAYWLVLRPCPWYHIPILSISACGLAGAITLITAGRDEEEKAP